MERTMGVGEARRILGDLDEVSRKREVVMMTRRAKIRAVVPIPIFRRSCSGFVTRPVS